MNKLDIFCFTSVARTKSFSLTAKELRISQQAVSKHIRAIEEETGYQLFFRDRTPVELTMAGSYMLEYFSLRSGIIEQIAAAFAVKNTGSSLTIGLSQWTGNPPWFLDAARQYRKLHPELELRLQNLDSAELLTAAARGKTDLLITSAYMTRYLPSSWRSAKLTEESLYIIRSASAVYDLDHLGLYPFFAPEAGETHPDMIRMRGLSVCRRLGFTPRNITICHDMGTVMLNVLFSGGITVGSYPPEKDKTDDYSYEKTDLSAQIMLSQPYHAELGPADDFASYIIRIAQNREEQK